MPKHFFKELFQKFKGTIALTLFILAGYLFLSEFGFFIPQETLQSASFDLSRPLNIFSYTITHAGYIHLLVNIISLLAFAVIVEYYFGTKDLLLIFFISQFIASIIFSALNPHKALIGASAGISGLLGAGIFSKPVKGLAALVLILVSVNFILLPLTNYLFIEHKTSVLETQEEIKSDLNTAIEEGDKNKMEGLSRKLEETTEKITKISDGEQVQKETPTDFLIHGYAGLIGAGYVLLFRKQKIKEGFNEMHSMLSKIGKRK
jgi:hypothetical protein